jgi:hypothetical protein
LEVVIYHYLEKPFSSASLSVPVNAQASFALQNAHPLQVNYPALPKKKRTIAGGLEIVDIFLLGQRDAKSIEKNTEIQKKRRVENSHCQFPREWENGERERKRGMVGSATAKSATNNQTHADKELRAFWYEVS